MDENKCYFSTFVDDITMTCCKDGKFDDYGFPINKCSESSKCNIIKNMNTKEEKRKRESKNLNNKHSRSDIK